MPGVGAFGSGTASATAPLVPGAISPRPSGGSSADGAPCVKEPCAESWANQPQVAVLDGGASLDPAWAVGRTHPTIA